jgi:hypothetical protein
MRQPYDKRVIMVRSGEQIARLHAIVDRLPLDEDRPIRVTFDDPLPAKSRDQEALYHVLIGDIAEQYEHAGRKWDSDSMKRILIDQFRKDTAKDPDIAHLWASMGQFEMAPSFDGLGVVMLGAQSRKFPMKLASVFVEWLYALGAELNIKWSEPKRKS